MSLAAGTKLGPYEISGLLGAGGMGEVYRARDSRLGRDVALKTLPDTFTHNADRVARFRREAQVLAALNHPHIGSIYGLEEVSGSAFLVLELIEGETLSDRIGRGPLPVDEALGIGRQIAQALSAAHEQGIVHRDLKPSNIKLRPDGVVKVLDFGLAKSLPCDTRTDRSQTSTLTALGTHMGVILGTAAYMSPEQARGLPVDKRTDIWAFGCVLYEMLAGRRAFDGHDASETLASVLTANPDVRRLDHTPLAIRRLVKRCLQKDRNERQRDISDARIEIEEVLAAPPTEVPVSVQPQPPFTRRMLSLLIGLGLLVGTSIIVAVAWLATRSVDGRVDAPVIRVLLEVTPAERLRSQPLDDSLGDGRPSRTAIALSPDGRSLVFSAVRAGQQHLFLRQLDRLDAVPIAGGEGGSAPFFSPDGQWVGFWAERMLKKVPLGGGTPVVLTEAPVFMGASWGADDRIVFALWADGLWQISAAGGKPQRLASLNMQPSGVSYRLPQLLPDGRAVLFTVARPVATNWDNTQVVVQSLATGRRTVLIEGGADARYVSTGHLVYVRNGALMAAPFDSARLEVTGGSVGLLSDLMQAANMSYAGLDSGAGQFSVSKSGALAYVPGSSMPDAERSLVWVDRAGRVEPFSGPQRFFFAPRLSPNGRYVAVFVGGTDQNIWIYDITRGTLAPLTVDGDTFFPVWAADGAHVVFPRREAASPYNLFRTVIDGSATPERLTRSDHAHLVSSVSPDNRELAFVEQGKIWVLPLTGDRQPRKIIDADNAAYPEFSPDGRWLAYTLSESGEQQVYVQAYPGPGGKQRISTDGGAEPAWRQDGRELFYRSDQAAGTRSAMMAVTIPSAPAFKVGIPRKLFEGAFVFTHPTRGYDVTRDGQRFLMVQHHERRPMDVRQIVLVHNWFEELKAKVPKK